MVSSKSFIAGPQLLFKNFIIGSTCKIVAVHFAGGLLDALGEKPMGLFNRKAAFACMERFSGMGELASCDDVTICCVDELARRCPDFLQLPIAALARFKGDSR